MAYATQADLAAQRVDEDLLVQLTADKGENVIVDAVVAGALDEASGLIDSYSRLRYAVPLQTSDQVKALCLDIAVYLLFLRRRRVSEDVQKAYDNAVAFLKDVAKGQAALDQPAAAAPQSGAGGVVATEIEEKFNDDNLAGF